MTDFLARRERFERIGSTNDVVRAWLAEGTGEVCLAVADEQTAGRGRAGRRWVAPSGAALLLSLGFRPAWLTPDSTWRLAACASLAMAEAAEAYAGLPTDTIRLKWPNDLVVETAAGMRKVAGVLGETDGLGGADPRVVVGLGIDTDWPATGFPVELASSMTSLREVAAGRPIDNAALLEAFIGRLEARIVDLRTGDFDAAGWADRQILTGRIVRLERPGGVDTVHVRSVDAATGALIVSDAASGGPERHVLVGEIDHARLAEPIAEAV